MAKTRTGMPLKKSPDDSFIGKVLSGRYQVLEKLSKSPGGIAVYKALHLYVKKFVVVKLLPASAAQDEILKERFMREGQAANLIQHPSVVEVYDMGETEEGVLYIVMEYLEGEPLSGLIKRGPLSQEMAVTVAVQTLEALGPAHALGVVHRDLNPEHIFLMTRAREGRFIKVLDFGIAHLSYEPQITQVGQKLGTPDTMAPEMISGGQVGGGADLYALGCILYAMLTGRFPFVGTAHDILEGHVKEQPERPSHLVMGIPPALDMVVLKLLEKDPESRYLDAYHAIRDLTDLGLALEDDTAQPIEPIPESDASRRTYPPRSARMERGAGPWARFVEDAQKLATTPEERSKADAMVALTEQLDGIDRRMENISIKLEALDREIRQSRQNIGRALEELARDQSVRNAGLLRSSARVADLHNGLESTSARAAEILGTGVLPEFGPDQPDLNRRVAEAILDLGRVAERWLQYREQADRERNTKRQHLREVRDIDFQLEELRKRLEKVTLEGEVAMNEHRRQLERYGRRRLILLDDLAELASAFGDKVEMPS